MERYHIYSLLSGTALLIDTKLRKISAYHSNLYGQVFDLKDGGDELSPSHARIAGLIRRMKNRSFSLANSYVTDPFIYRYIMTDEQREKCGWELNISCANEMIGKTDSYKEALTKMCEWMYERTFCGSKSEKDANRIRYTQYYKDYLAETPLPEQ